MIVSALVSSAYIVSSLPVAESSTTSSGDDKWTYLGLLLTSIIAPIIILVISNRTLKAPGGGNSGNNDTENVSTTRGTTFSIDGMPSNMVTVLLSMWEKIDEMEDIQKNWSMEREEFIRINEELRRHNRALAEGFDDVIDWIDQGAHPPPPSVAQHLRDLVQHAMSRPPGPYEVNES